jgi:hypothetical protein
MRAVVYSTHGRVADRGRQSASLQARTTILSEGRLRQQGKLRGSEALAGRPCYGATAHTDPRSHLVPSSNAANGRVSRAMRVCAVPDVVDRRSRYVI